MSIITNVLKIYEKSSCKSCVECSVELCRAENISKFYEIGSFASFNSTWYWYIYNTGIVQILRTQRTIDNRN